MSIPVKHGHNPNKNILPVNSSDSLLGSRTPQISFSLVPFN